jgi:diaminopimelate decarboxylase
MNNSNLIIGKRETQFQLILFDVIEKNYHELQNVLPFAKIHFEAKANPNPEVLRLLNKLGASFDVTSVYELRRLQELGISAERMSCGNTIKKFEHVNEFYNAGIRLFIARKLGLQPWGLSFYVGSQQRDITAWDSVLSKVTYFLCSPSFAGEGRHYPVVHQHGRRVSRDIPGEGQPGGKRKFDAATT